VAIERDVLDVGVAFVLQQAERALERIGDRSADRAADLPAVEAADRQVHRAGQHLVRIGGDDLDGATGSVAPVQSALRTAQYFDAFHVREIENGTLHARMELAVDVKADRAVGGRGRLVFADAAQEHTRRVRQRG